MRRYQIDVTAQTSADSATVYALLRDGSTWPDWTSIDSFELEREGEHEKEGPGAIRIFRDGWIEGRDEITGFVTDRRFSYAHLSGLPVRDYRGEVDLESTGGGTAIHWHVAFTPKVPCTGWLLNRALYRFIGQTARGLAEYAAKL